MNSIITRFAPSPTGNLHIGGVRTALINYILTKQAKKNFPDSKFLLRIEDTDKKRSSDEFKNSILNGLKWLNIHYDDQPYLQSSKINRHQEIALELLKNNKAFKCICSKENLERKREENRKNKVNNKKLCSTCEKNKKIQSLINGFTLRIKIPDDGETIVNDLIQGKIKVQNKEIDDFVLIRKDGTPTYMLSVVVDDFDMGVNLIIRGNDHLNNVFRQNFIYSNMNWPIPKYAHLPLIHGEDGKKLSKRHGAVNINEFKEKGYLTKSIINNLILLGWSPENLNEFIEIDEIIRLFDIKKLSKSSSIFSYDKLNFFNNYYIKNDKNLNNLNNFCNNNLILKEFLSIDKNKLLRIFSIYKKNLNFYKNLENISIPYFDKKYQTNSNILFNDSFNELVKDFLYILEKINEWNLENLENQIKIFVDSKKIKFSMFGKPIRLLLINKENGPSINDILFILSKKNSIDRIKNYINIK